MSDDKVIESHQPLLDLKQITRLDDLSKGLSLNQANDQKLFLARIGKVELGVSVDHVLEYLVNNRDVPIGSVDATVKLNCDAARRIHWGAERLKRHKARGSQSAAVKVSKEMAGSRA